MSCSPIKLILVMFLIFGAMRFALAQSMGEEANQASGGDTVPEGMQKVQITSGYQLLVPNDAKVSQTGGQITIENNWEYVVRRLNEVLERLTKIEKDQEELKQYSEDVKKDQEDLKSEQEGLKRNQADLKKSFEYIEDRIIQRQDNIEASVRSLDYESAQRDRTIETIQKDISSLRQSLNAVESRMKSSGAKTTASK